MDQKHQHRLPFFKKTFQKPSNSIPAPSINKASYEITHEILRLVKNNILGNIPPMHIRKFLGSEEVDKCEFINEHAVTSVVKLLEKCVISPLDKINTAQ